MNKKEDNSLEEDEDIRGKFLIEGFIRDRLVKDNLAKEKDFVFNKLFKLHNALLMIVMLAIITMKREIILECLIVMILTRLISISKDNAKFYECDKYRVLVLVPKSILSLSMEVGFILYATISSLTNDVELLPWFVFSLAIIGSQFIVAFEFNRECAGNFILEEFSCKMNDKD